MCAHYRVGQGLLEFLEQFGIETEGVTLPHPIQEECRPTNHIPIILTNPQSKNKELQFIRWGLVPSWAKDPKIGASMINARAETIAIKPAYKNAFRKRRCIIPMETFYEYDNNSRYKIHLEDDSTMGVAGIWETAHIDEKPDFKTCSLITTKANLLISKVHDRMPAILRPELYDAWLESEIENPEQLRSMLQPYESNKMRLEFDAHKKTAKPKSGQHTLSMDE